MAGLHTNEPQQTERQRERKDGGKETENFHRKQTLMHKHAVFVLFAVHRV